MNVDLNQSILVFNKIDKLMNESIKIVENKYKNCIFISGKKKNNLEKLKEYILFRIGI